jgi:hypothetical protein
VPKPHSLKISLGWFYSTASASRNFRAPAHRQIMIGNSESMY